MEKYIVELFQKVENGTIEPFEKEILIAWSDSNDYSESDYNQYLKEDWSKISQQIGSIKKIPKTKVFNIYRWTAVAASVLVLIVFAVHFFTKTEQLEIYSTIDVKEVILPDNSIVTLNKNSSIKYNSKFGQSNRDINLNGSAYFNVVKNKELPFIIQTKSAVTQVLGTAFYLEESEKDSLVLLDVDEGTVSIKVEDNQPVLKTVGEKFCFNKVTHTVSKYQMTNNDKYWKTKKLIFEDSNLEDALADISKAYEVTVSCKDDISNCKLSSTFNGDELSDLLDILATTYQGKWTKTKADTYQLKGIHCK